jgi:hypothetical protein
VSLCLPGIRFPGISTSPDVFASTLSKWGWFFDVFASKLAQTQSQRAIYAGDLAPLRKGGNGIGLIQWQRFGPSAVWPRGESPRTSWGSPQPLGTKAAGAHDLEPHRQLARRGDSHPFGEHVVVRDLDFLQDPAVQVAGRSDATLR